MVLITVTKELPEEPNATVRSSLYQEAVVALELLGFKIVEIREEGEKSVRAR